MAYAMLSYKQLSNNCAFDLEDQVKDSVDGSVSELNDVVSTEPAAEQSGALSFNSWKNSGSTEEDIVDPIYELGIKYSSGIDTEENLVLAHKWFNIAALRGNVAARAHRAAIASTLTAEEIATALKLARDWINGATDEDATPATA